MSDRALTGVGDCFVIGCLALIWSEAPYHEWSMLRKGRGKLVVDRWFIDGLKCCLRANPDLVDPPLTRSRVVMMKQNPVLAAAELSKEVTIDPISYDAAKY